MGCIFGKKPNPLKTDMSHFSLLRTIGKGGFGTVTAVVKESEPFKGKYFAIKKLAKSQLIDSNSGIKVAWRERNILQMIDSPFLPKLHWAFQDHACLYLVMDFLSGGDIGYLIKQRKRIEPDTARFYAGEIALAMQELHRKKIVYRDLKPANVLLDKRGHCRIIDFGIASFLDEKNGNKTLGDAGTPGYQSPEMCRGDQYQFEPDFFAYGVTLYKMLSGHTPFEDNETMFKNNCEPKTWKYVPEQAQELIRMLLQPDPGKRLTDWNELQRHAFFKETNWGVLAKCDGDGPIIPDPDIANFPVECNAEALLLPETDNPVQDQTIFAGYTYNSYSAATKNTAAQQPGKAVNQQRQSSASQNPKTVAMMSPVPSSPAPSKPSQPSIPVESPPNNEVKSFPQ